MKKLLAVVLICLASNVWAAKDADEKVGSWSVLPSGGYDIFEGYAKSLYVKSNPKSQQKEMFLIYDTSNHGLLCSKIADRFSEMACLMVETLKQDITPEDEGDKVVKALPNISYLIVDFRRVGNKLKVEGYPMDASDCVIDMSCDYGTLGILEPYQD